MEKILQNIKQNAIFSQFTDDQLCQLIPLLNPSYKSYKKNQIVLQKGDTLKQIGILCEGKLLLYHEMFQHRSHLITIINPVEMFAEAFIMAREYQSHITIKTQKQSTILWINHIPNQPITCPTLQHILNDYHASLTQSLAQKTLFLQRKLYILGQANLQLSIIALLNLYHRGDNLVILPFKTEQELADYLCVNRSFLSRLLSTMEKQKIIQRIRKPPLLELKTNALIPVLKLHEPIKFMLSDRNFI